MALQASRDRRAAWVAGAALLAVALFHGQARADWDGCNYISYLPLEFTLPACTALIEQGGLSDTELQLALRRRADALFYGSSLGRAGAGTRAALVERALADIDRAMTLGPEPAPAPEAAPIWLGPMVLARAELLYVLSRFEDAVAAYGAALDQIAGPPSTARLGRAMALEQLGRFDEALADMTVLIDQHPDDAQWLFLRAEVIERGGDREAAIGEYRAVLARDPAHVGARQALLRLGANP